MSYVICHLCRAKIVCPEGNTRPDRCPKCQGKVLEQAEFFQEEKTAEYRDLICPNCLGHFTAQIWHPGEHCPVCGTNVDEESASALGRHTEEIELSPKNRLLAGESAGTVVAYLQELGVSADTAWRYLDRLVSELPFERFKQEENGNPVLLAPCCDSCGINGELALYDAQWELNPDEMKRYRNGYAGFEGKFADSRQYARPAVYTLCKRCYKRAGKLDFADGYPLNIGFMLKKIKKRK